MRNLVNVFIGVVLLAAGWGLAQGLQRDLTISMGEMFFQLEGQDQNETITLEAGIPYRITFSNVGTLVHRVKFGRGLVIEEGVPFAYTEDLFAGVPVKILGLEDLDGVRIISDQLIELDLDAGKQVEVTFTLPVMKAGEWELGCFVIGHYEAGMRTTLVIE